MNIWNKIKFFFRKLFLGRPETDRNWSTLYYGPRGSGKTLHQSRETENILRFLVRLYKLYPDLNRAIVFTNSKLSPRIEEKYKDYIYYWNEPEDFRYCPRENCWKGKKKHRLHGCYLIFDDLANILPASEWQNVAMWLRKTFFQGRHFGIRILGNVQDPASIFIDFRRCLDMAYKFSKIFGNSDPDETKPKVKRIFGMYRRRKIPADLLWKYGDLPEQTIRLLMEQREEQNEQLKQIGKEYDIVYDDSWKGSYHLFNRTGKFLFGLMRIGSTEIYDTLQDVQEYEPQGFLHKEYYCIDPRHNHDDPKAENYCNYKKVKHELI
jgi:hypothetical protein